MNKKKTIFAFTLAASMLIGVGAVTFKMNQSNVKEAEAASKVTVYLDVKNQVTSQYSSMYWENDNAITKIYYSGGASSSGSTGVTMTKVMNGIYSYDIPKGTTSLNFFRADPNSPSTIWNRCIEEGFDLIPASTDYTSNNIFKMVHFGWTNPDTAGYWNGLADVPSEDGYYLVGNETFLSSIGKTGTTWRYDTGKQMTTLGNSGDKAKIYSLYLLEGSILKVRSLINQNESWHDSCISYGTSGVSIVDGNYSITTSGRYSIFVNEYNQAYISNASLTPAINAAKAFNNNMETACLAENKTIQTLTSAWSDQLSAFALLDEETLAILKDVKTTDEDDDLAAFAEKYDFIYGKYGYDNNWVDFANRNPQKISGSNRLAIISNVDEGLLTIIVVVIGLSSLIATSYLFLRKRRNIIE